MRKKYRVRRPRVRFGPVLFPLVSVLLLVGTVYGWMSFIRSSSHGFGSSSEGELPLQALASSSSEEGSPAAFPAQSDPETPKPSSSPSDMPVIAVPGGESALPQGVVLPGSTIAALPEGFGTVPGGIWIAVDKSDFKVRLCEGARILKEYPVGIGANPGNKEKSGDKRTPEGRFSIESIHDSSTWTHDYKDGRGPVKGVYGPWFLRLRMPWSGLGICGTPDPNLVGKRSTRGSIRMLNKDIEELRKRVEAGTTVIIMP